MRAFLTYLSLYQIVIVARPCPLVDGHGIYNFTPPTGGQGKKDVWAVCDVTVANGQVVSVTPINTIAHNVNSSDELSFSP